MKDLVVELPLGSPSKVAIVVLPGCSILELGAVVEPLAFVARRYPACLAAIELAGPRR